MFTVPSSLFAPLPNHLIHKQKLLNLFDTLNAKNNIDLENDHVSTDYFVNRENHTYCCYHDYVCDCLSEYLNIFSARTNNTDWIVGDMWYQQSKRNQRHEVHNHGSTGFSAIWYLEFDPSFHKPTTFTAPFPDALTGNLLQGSPNVREGSLFIFPSFILHEQEESKTDVRRTVVSFNLFTKFQWKSRVPQVDL